jgi:pimeloyl-ACP methyl ester carboxylesterase
MAAPLLLLPGLICDDRIWDAQVRDLSEFSPIAVSGYGLARNLRDMALRALELAPPVFSVVGHSMGARVALEVFREAPDRVERLALLDTGVHPPQPGEAAKRHALLALGRQHGIERLVDEWLPPMVHPDHAREAGIMEPLRAMCIAAGVDTYEAQITALLGRPEASPLLPTINGPVLVACGREDVWSPPEQHEEMAAAIPDAELVIFDHCGHMAPVEAPDQVNVALRRWLDRPKAQ